MTRMRTRYISRRTASPVFPFRVPQFTPEETFTWWVYHHQQPLMIPSLDSETRFPAVAEMPKNRGVRSVCVLPLTTVDRRLGGLAFGSIEPDAYSEEEVNFLSFVANQVALALDDAPTSTPYNVPRTRCARANRVFA